MRLPQYIRTLRDSYYLLITTSLFNASRYNYQKFILTQLFSTESAFVLYNTGTLLHLGRDLYKAGKLKTSITHTDNAHCTIFITDPVVFITYLPNLRALDRINMTEIVKKYILIYNFRNDFMKRPSCCSTKL